MTLRVNNIIDSDGMVRKGSFCTAVIDQVTNTIMESHNVSSTTSLGTGDELIQFNFHAIASTSYTVFISCTGTIASTLVNGQVATHSNQSEPWYQNSDRVRVLHGVGKSFPNSNYLMVNVVGD